MDNSLRQEPMDQIAALPKRLRTWVYYDPLTKRDVRHRRTNCHQQRIVSLTFKRHTNYHDDPMVNQLPKRHVRLCFGFPCTSRIRLQHEVAEMVILTSGILYATV